MHFADELSQGDVGQVSFDGLLGALGHAAHDALHVAAHVALFEHFPLADRNHLAGFDRVIDIGERNFARLFSQPGAAVLAGEGLDQLGRRSARSNRRTTTGLVLTLAASVCESITSPGENASAVMM